MTKSTIVEWNERATCSVNVINIGASGGRSYASSKAQVPRPDSLSLYVGAGHIYEGRGCKHFG